MGRGVRLPRLPLGGLLTLALAAVLLALFGRGLLRARRLGLAAQAGRDRAALFGAAVGVGVLAVLVLHEPGESRASAHMLQHVLVGDVAPALALVALRGPLLGLVVPAPLARLGRTGPVRRLLRPGPSLAVWAGLLWLWHVPPVYDAALASAPLHVLEHASFVAGGLLIWNVLIDPAGRRALTLGGSLAYALAVMVAAQLLVMTLVLAYRPLYVYGDAADQSTAGLIMALSQFATLGTYAVIRLRTHFRAPVELRAGHPLRS